MPNDTKTPKLGLTLGKKRGPNPEDGELDDEDEEPADAPARPLTTADSLTT